MLGPLFTDSHLCADNVQWTVPICPVQMMMRISPVFGFKMRVRMSHLIVNNRKGEFVSDSMTQLNDVWAVTKANSAAAFYRLDREGSGGHMTSASSVSHMKPQEPNVDLELDVKVFVNSGKCVLHTKPKEDDSHDSSKYVARNSSKCGTQEWEAHVFYICCPLVGVREGDRSEVGRATTCWAPVRFRSARIAPILPSPLCASSLPLWTRRPVTTWMWPCSTSLD